MNGIINKKRILPFLLMFLIIFSLTDVNSYACIVTEPGHECQEVFDTITSPTDIKNYQVTLDFTNRDSIAFSLVRLGSGGVSAQINDENAATVATMTLVPADQQYGTGAVDWYILNKPNPDVDLYTYTIQVTGSGQADNRFHLVVGDPADLPAHMSGLENAIYLDTFRNYDASGNLYVNRFYGRFIPNQQEVYYRFFGTGKMTALTLCSNFTSDLGYRIYELNNDQYTLLYDTANDTQAVRTQWVSPFSSILKNKLSTVLNREYLLEVYTPLESQNSLSRLNDTYYLYVGEPLLTQNNVTFYSSTSITGTSTTFSPSATINTVTNVPNTAEVKRVSLKSATSGITSSKIQYWRVKNATDVSWKTSPNLISSFDIPYTPCGTGNSKLRSSWLFSFKSTSSSSPLTFIPGIMFVYDYELGD